MELLDRDARASDLRALAGAGLLDERALEEAMKATGRRPDAASWRAWGGRFLALLGGCLAGSGVIVFFAANWQALSRWGRFGLVLAVFVTVIALAMKAGLDRLAGRAFALVALVLVGPVFAVYGQEWQTGADAFDLFVAWAVLATGFAWASRLELAWAAWLSIVHVAIWLWLDQWFGSLEDLWLARTTVAVFDAGVVAVARRVGLRGLLPRFAAVLSMLVSGLPAVLLVALEGAPGNFAVDLGVHLLLVAAALAVFRRRQPDLFMVALASTALALLVAALAFRIMANVGWDVDTTLVYGLCLAGLAWALAKWLRGEQARMHVSEEA